AGGRIWETLTGQLVTQFTGKDLRIGRLDWSPNGERIVTADHEGSHARIWDIPNGRELFSTWEVDESTWAVAFSPDSGQFAVSTGGGMLKIRSALDGHEASSLNTGQPAFAVAFSPDGRRLAYTTSGNRTMVRALANPFGSSIRLSHSLNTNGIGPGSLGSKSAVCVAFSPDSKEIVTGGRDKLAKVWEASTGRELSILKGHIGAVTSVAFSADGSRIVTRGDDGTARVWERATGQELLQFKVGEFAGFSFSKDGARIVGVQDSDAVIWDASNGVELLRVDADVRTAILSTDGKHLLAGTGRNTVDLWDVGTAKKLRTLTSHTATVWAIAFSPDGKTIVSGGLDRTPVVWDAVTGRMLRRLEGHSGPIWSVAFSGDGKRIVTGSADQTTRLWDAETGLELLVLPGQTDVRAAISPNGRYIASLDGDSVRVWIAASPEEMETWNQSGK
ncbi:MAG: repeat-containing protein, partial [Verrucomicrobiales bacterium]|nr:repeat-containing protein [Verrucomicrobiales bacterium]